MSLLNDALSLHQETLDAAAGEDVIYIRGSSWVTLRAIIGETTAMQDAGGDLISEFRTVDFLIAPENLAVNFAKTEPQRGDQIKRGDGSVFDVLPDASGSVWRWSDGRQTHFRIHTDRRRK
jgi:hypothetical protein